MLTTGSKLFLGLSTASVVALLVYGITQDFGALGSIGLIVVAVALAGLGALTLYIRDADVSAMDDVAMRTSAAAAPPVDGSMWPLAGAVGAVLLLIGVITDPRWFIAGVAVIIVAIAEWTVQAWSERASGDPAYNAEIRKRLMHPLELPIAGAIGLVILIFGFSRLMLALPRDAGAPLFVVAAGIILIFGVIFASRPNLRRGVVAGITAVGAVAILAGGIAGAVVGERDELTQAQEEDHLAHRSCSAEPDEHSDEKASGAVAAKANVFATLTLVEGGTLEVDQIADSLAGAPLTIDRANPVHLMFTNKTDEERRLRVYGGQEVVRDETGAPVTGSDGEQVTQDREFCTQAIGKGETQLLTVRLPVPSVYADDPFYAEVPGVDGARVEIVVP